MVSEAQAQSNRIEHGLVNIGTTTLSSTSVLVELGTTRFVNEKQILCNNDVSLPITDKNKKDVQIKSSYKHKELY